MKKWKCTVCGYMHDRDTPPESCPVCGATEDKFVEMSDTVQTSSAVYQAQQKDGQSYLNCNLHGLRASET